jgi:hypothetical protein
MSIKVCDNFYPYPDLMREIALRSPYYVPKGYVGHRSRKGFIPSDTLARIKAVFGFERIELENVRDRTGHFYISTNRDPNRSSFYAHQDAPYDPRRPLFALVVYLTPDAPRDAGTCMVRHRETGILRYPTAAEARQLGVSRSTLVKYLDEDGSDRDKWDELSSVENVFNRAVLFPASEYHSSSRDFGRHVGNAKLYHTFFLYGSPNPWEPS